MPMGYVYVIGPRDSSVVKIGRAVNPGRRLATIQNAHPAKVEILWSTQGGAALEGRLHAEFDHLRSFGEWFDFGDTDPVDAIKEAVGRIDPPAATEAGMQDARVRLAELKLLRIEADALQRIAAESIETEVLRALRDGLGPSEIARLGGISDSYVRTLRRKRELSTPPPGPAD